MKYFEEMLTKWGFGDGESVPSGAEQYREVYVLAINRLAEIGGSKVRAFAYDRSGLHNWCLILFVDKETVELGQDLDYLAAVGSTVFPQEFIREMDPAMERAVLQAKNLNLDAWLATTVEVDPEFDDYLLSGQIGVEGETAIEEDKTVFEKNTEPAPQKTLPTIKEMSGSIDFGEPE